MDIIVSGTITGSQPVQTGTSQRGTQWTKQTFKMCHEEGQFPKELTFDVFSAEKLAEFNLQQGERVTVHLSFDLREYNGRWFNNVQAWKVERGVAQQPRPAQPQQYAQPAPQYAPQPQGYAPQPQYAPQPTYQAPPQQQYAPQGNPVQQSGSGDPLPF